MGRNTSPQSHKLLYQSRPVRITAMPCSSRRAGKKPTVVGFQASGYSPRNGKRVKALLTMAGLGKEAFTKEQPWHSNLGSQ